MKEKNDSGITSEEGVTGDGQILWFYYYMNNKADEIKKFLREKIHSIHIPIDKKIVTSCINYDKYSRYEIIQHDYAGGTGYVEVLEIKNPPDGRCGFIINSHDNFGNSFFIEWDSVDNAKTAFNRWFGGLEEDKLSECKGFKRRVFCGELTPWFYAIGDEELIRDYVFPQGLQDDPVYRFGEKFVVMEKDFFNDNIYPKIKVCMGSRVIKKRGSNYPYEEYFERIVYWDDGTTWKDTGYSDTPRLLREEELWINEAIHKFAEMLSGNTDKFEINFTDGNKFVGKFQKAKHYIHCEEGRYDIIATLEDENGQQKTEERYVDFKPSKEYPDVNRNIEASYEKKEKKVVKRVQITSCKKRRGGKKWSGVFYNRKK